MRRMTAVIATDRQIDPDEPRPHEERRADDAEADEPVGPRVIAVRDERGAVEPPPGS
jgi:hypothetical protein